MHIPVYNIHLFCFCVQDGTVIFPPLSSPSSTGFLLQPKEKTRQVVYISSWEASCCVQEGLYCNCQCQKSVFPLLGKPRVFTSLVMYKTDFYLFYPQSGTSIQDHVDAISSTTQPYLLAIGMKTINKFFIVLDKQVKPYKSTSSLGAFDELFKTHFVFGTIYNQVLHNMYTFIQKTVYNIDICKARRAHVLPRSGPDSYTS